IEVIQRYDSEETLFYCDPPYPHDSRGDANAYRYEMTDDEHRQLAKVLKEVKGKVALSGYHCDLLDQLYEDWDYIESYPKQCLSVKQPRTEVLWVNYDLPKDAGKWLNQQESSMPLFDVLPATWDSH
ncbi:MAG: DNA adenine methylase, partial [Leptolyngbyaceae cyanobacterium RM2_2_4]|nr:DNA adenine methylase [Leptolyngbyaceae cyanobacterium RM2_2_4]